MAKRPATIPGTGPAPASQPELVAVDTKHPDYIDHQDEWQLMRDTARGRKAVLDRAREYLPMPIGFTSQADKGAAMYAAYQKRAQVPTLVGPTIAGMSGVIHQTEVQIEMPDAMLPLWERATPDGMPLEALHQRITHELLTVGRIGLLVDANTEAVGGSAIPYIVDYTTEQMINWSAKSDFYVLDETSLQRNGFRWESVPKWRVLELVDGAYRVTVYEGTARAPSESIEPTSLGGKRLDAIPFVSIGAIALDNKPVTPPLIGVADSTISIYQLSADYRHQLFSSGQETLFVYNMDAPDVIGAGVIVNVEPVPKEMHPPEAKYVGPSGVGIEAHKIAIADELEQAAKAGARLFDQAENKQESGDARSIRFAAETATLTTLSRASAAGLERALRYIAVMMNLDPELVVVTPNLSFLDTKLSPSDIEKLVKAWQNNAISYQTLYENLRRGEIASPERTHEDEVELMAGEAAEFEELLATRSAALKGVRPEDDTAVEE